MQILKNCRAVIPEDGTLLIIEFILPTVSQADPHLEARLMSDLNLLAVNGGKDEPRMKWGALLETAEFRLAAVHPAGSEVGIVEAKIA